MNRQTNDGSNVQGLSTEPCNIVPVGKRRDGKMRYWCLAHRANGTAKHGIAASMCSNASAPPISEAEILEFDVDQFAGGTALWGAVPAIYDTTRLPMDRGIHVHARRKTGDRKEIDCTYRAVRVRGKGFPAEGILISEVESIYYMVSSVFGFGTKLVRCTYCKFPHLDKDFFSVNPHRRHLCAGCGKHFFDKERGIGNPVSSLQQTSGITPLPPSSPNRIIKISQSEYPGGVQIWGSNAALLWTGTATEEAGIHVHAYKQDRCKPTVDDTYASVAIDGVALDVNQVRVLMAQRAMPSLAGRIVSLKCENCGTSIFELGAPAYIPTSIHRCGVCGKEITTKVKYRNVVPNPLVETLKTIAETAIRAPQSHSLELRPEVL